MAEKTNTYYVRLLKSWTRSHRRAGIEFPPGPQYTEVELTDEQFEAVKADPSFEIGDAKAAAEADKNYGKLTPQQDGSADELQDPANISGEIDEGTTPQTSRREMDDPTRSGSPEAGPTAPAPLSGHESESSLMARSTSELRALATASGVEDLDKMETKTEVTQAILAKQDESHVDSSNDDGKSNDTAPKTDTTPKTSSKKG